MATSESDGDFESADEELGCGVSSRRDTQTTSYWAATKRPTTVDSESDDGTEYVEYISCRSSIPQKKRDIWVTSLPDVAMSPPTAVGDKDDKTDSDVKVESSVHMEKSADCMEKTSDNQEGTSVLVKTNKSSVSDSAVEKKDVDPVVGSHKITKSKDTMSKAEAARSEVSRTSRRNPSRQLGAKKLGTKVTNLEKSLLADDAKAKKASMFDCTNQESLHSENKDVECKLQEGSQDQTTDNQAGSQSMDNLQEMDIPEELRSNKKFKEVFQPEGWEGLGNDIELPDELTEEKLQPILEKLSLASKESESSLDSWGNWGNWGVTSLINTAATSMSTLTNHVSQGLTLFDSAIEIAEPTEVTETKEDEVTGSSSTTTNAEISETQEERSSSYSSFGFGNIMSGVSSITKLVELTGSKVVTGSLDTLEAIGKKTMEVLQDGDPGLKKKRAFFMNETHKPILSQILREAKEKAETEERTIEERMLSRKVHFETLFDDYQGLVHLEALEILSKQSEMKIQQYLIELDTRKLPSMQETLEEIKELSCDLDIEGLEEEKFEKNFKNRIEAACCDLGVDITYEKLYDIWTETENYLASSSTHTSQEIFQNAISTLAQFTAFSMERFHKTAELLLIKERRNTVKETNSLGQITVILTDQICLLAKSFCDTLDRFTETEKEDANMMIFLKGSNAISYVREAFKLFIPILQVGVIY